MGRGWWGGRLREGVWMGVDKVGGGEGEGGDGRKEMWRGGWNM